MCNVMVLGGTHVHWLTKKNVNENENVFIMKIREMFKKKMLLSWIHQLYVEITLSALFKAKRHWSCSIRPEIKQCITSYNTHIWSFVYMSTHGWSRQIRWAVNSPFAFAFVSSTESSDCYMSSYFCSTFLLCQRDNEISTQMHMQRKEEISNLPPQNHTKKKHFLSLFFVFFFWLLFFSF